MSLRAVMLASLVAFPAWADTYVLTPNNVVRGGPVTPNAGRTLSTDWPADMVPSFVDLTTLPSPLTAATAPAVGSTYNPTTQMFTAPVVTVLTPTGPCPAAGALNADCSINAAAAGLATSTQLAGVQASVTAIQTANPLTAVAPGAIGHVTATRMDGTTADMVPTISGDASGSATATTVAVQRFAYTTVVVAVGSTVQLPYGYAIYDMTGAGLVAAATLRLPANPPDKYTVKLVATGTLQVTALAVQDASGNAVGVSIGLGVGGTALYQYQGTAWQRIGT